MRRLANPGWLGILLPTLGACAGRNAAVPVGGACSSDDVCLTGACIPATDTNGQATHWVGGYCSGNCATSACPQGSCLTLTDGRSYCVATCTQAGDCRTGYVCDQHVSACLPDCRAGWSCGSTLVCNSSSGGCERARGTVPVGGACSFDNDCTHPYCIPALDVDGRATGWADGYCSGDCSDSSCPEGSCLTLADASKLCVATCAADDDCRSGYVCAKAAAACLPDCRAGWSRGSTLVCSAANGNCELGTPSP